MKTRLLFLSLLLTTLSFAQQKSAPGMQPGWNKVIDDRENRRLKFIPRTPENQAIDEANEARARTNKIIYWCCGIVMVGGAIGAVAALRRR